MPHAGCFAMALSLMLGENHTPPERLAIEAACTLDEVDGAPRITTVALTIRALVPGLEQASFEQAVERAAGLCPVSSALRGNVEISVQSELALPMTPARLRRLIGTSSLIWECLPQTSHVTEVRR